MAAFNYVVFEERCPHCDRQVVLKAQTHIASDYEGDEHGRFMDHEYQLGERMKWFSRTHPDFDTWKTWGGEGDTIHEDCPASCPSCNTKLNAQIAFEDLTPVAVTNLSVWAAPSRP